MHNIMNLCDFSAALPRAPGGTEASEIGLEIALGRHLNFRPSCDSLLLRWRVEFVMSLGKWDLWVRGGGRPVQAASAHFLSGQLGLWKVH